MYNRVLYKKYYLLLQDSFFYFIVYNKNPIKLTKNVHMQWDVAAQTRRIKPVTFIYLQGIIL